MRHTSTTYWPLKIEYNCVLKLNEHNTLTNTNGVDDGLLEVLLVVHSDRVV